jgi:transposase
MKTYSVDLRERIVAALQEGSSVREVALRFGVSHDTVQRYRSRHEQGQSLLPSPRLGRAPRVAPQEQEAFIAMVRENPNATLAQMSALWQERTGVTLPRATMHDHVRRLGGRFKKESHRQ